MKRLGRYLPPFALALLTTSLAGAADRSSINAYSTAEEAPARARIRARNAQAIAGSVDEKRGVPTFLWATSDVQASGPLVAAPSVEAAAWSHVRRLADRYGLSDEALKTAHVSFVHDTGRGGIIVGFSQEVDGIELFQVRMRVLMTRAKDLVAAAGNLHASAVPDALKLQGRGFKRPMIVAAAGALGDLYGLPVDASSLVDTKTAKAGYAYFSLADTKAIQAAGVSFTRPLRAKKVLFPLPDRLVPAYFIEVQASKLGASVDDGYAYVIAADDGRVLYRESLTQFEAFQYRVWADDSPEHRPLDGPQYDFTPHPTGVPDGSVAPFVAPSLISMEGFNTNPGGKADPWLAVGALQTLGNNVDAYSDHDDPNGYSNGDLRASVTAPGVFDRIYDVAAAPLATADQTMASVTQLFYVNNWMHDYWYDSGFNEASGNAQKNNLGRGGVGNDPLLVEAQDGYLKGNRNNANMNTPADGESPRMQMYVWSGKETRTLTIQPLGSTPKTGSAGFGPEDYNVSAELAQPDDGLDPITDGCEPFVSTLAGKIAFIDRGICTFKLKTFNAEAAGAVGVVITNNAPEGDPKGGITGMSDGDPSLTVTIPALFISKEEGDLIKTAMVSGPQTATLLRDVDIAHDGTIDNGIIAHEWGHYLHHRLVSCGGVVCGGMSEGWADFNALMLVMREGDDLDGAYATGGYAGASFTDAFYYGIRRAPYSTDMSKSPFTFKHMTTDEPLPTGAALAQTSSNNAEVHNSGEIWSEMLFEGLVSLLKKSQAPGATVTFEQARRAMTDYIVAGMMLTPPNPTYTEQRDGVLAAALAQDKDDALLIAEAFAKRGMGSCAISPPRFSVDNKGLVESFEVKPRLAITKVTLDDSVKSCDGDGFLDAEEVGRVTVELVNPSLLPLKGTEVELSSMTPGIKFPSGSTIVIDDIPPFQAVTRTIDVGLDEGVAAIVNLNVTVTATNADACEASVSAASAPRGNYDNVASQSATDTFESDLFAWTTAGPGADAIWTRQQPKPDNRTVLGADSSTFSDTSFVSPPLEVSDQESFILSFTHVYRFETSFDDPATPEDETVYWDGGVIEISTDGGKAWKDISLYGDPGYNGTLGGADSANFLINRPAFVDRSLTYPATNKVTIDMGTSLAGKTALVRFRIGTDASGGGEGWTLDDISFQGIKNTPFPVVVDDSSLCEHAPIAKAGDDQSANEVALVMLDATASSDDDGDALTFSWAQTGGPSVKLGDEAAAKPLFTTPSIEEDATLTFEVTVSDGKKSAKDAVDVFVKARPADVAPDAGAGGEAGDAGDATYPGSSDSGCACEAAGAPERTREPDLGLAFAASLLGLAITRRRRGSPRRPA